MELICTCARVQIGYLACSRPYLKQPMRTPPSLAASAARVQRCIAGVIRSVHASKLDLECRMQTSSSLLIKLPDQALAWLAVRYTCQSWLTARGLRHWRIMDRQKRVIVACRIRVQDMVELYARKPATDTVCGHP